jgi:transposase
VVALPWKKGEDPLILVTNFEVRTLKEAVKLLKLYEKRWQIETGFETCKRELGLERFMVRSLKAIERLLDLVMLAYALLVVLLLAGQWELRRLREEVERLLSRWSVRRPGERLTVGKLKEGLALDGRQNREAWMALLQLTGEFS